MDIIEIMDMRIEELPIKEFDCLDYISDDVLDIEFVPIEDMHIDVIENEYSYDVRWDIDDLNNYWNGMLQGFRILLIMQKIILKIILSMELVKWFQNI